MILPHPSDAIHKAWLYRLLSAIADDHYLAQHLYFKGGTCAAMQGIIERFSIDLDFDVASPAGQKPDRSQITQIQQALEKIFRQYGLSIKDHSQVAPQYFLKYENNSTQRNTLKIDASFPPPASNEYEPVRFIEIDRIITCQTVPTMFANKLVAIMDRFDKQGSIAGRDLFDIHTFFLKGYTYRSEIIEERTGKSSVVFLKDVKTFIEKKVTQRIIDQDINTLLPPKEFQKVRKSLKQEVLLFL